MYCFVFLPGGGGGSSGFRFCGIWGAELAAWVESTRWRILGISQVFRDLYDEQKPSETPTLKP